MCSKEKHIEDKGSFKIPSYSEIDLLPVREQVSTSPKDVEGRMYAVLSNNLSSSKNPSLFESTDDDKENVDSSLTPAEIEAINQSDKDLGITRNSLPLCYTPLQKRIIFELCDFISKFRYDRDIIHMVDNLNNIFQGHTELHIKIERKVQTSKIAKKVLGRATRRDREKIFKEIDFLGKSLQAITQPYADSKGNKTNRVKAATLINIDTTDILYSDDGIPEEYGIQFNPIFIDRFINIYVPIKSYFQELSRENKIGNNPIYFVLYDILSSHWWNHICQARNIEKKMIKEFGGINTPEQLDDIEKAKLNKLEYSLDLETIEKKLAREHNNSRKARKDFFELLQTAIDYLIRYGIITQGSHISKNENKVYFIFNMNFENQTKPLPAIEP